MVPTLTEILSPGVLRLAFEPALLRQIPGVRLVADRADYNSVRPAHLDHVGVAAVRVGKELNRGLEGFGGFKAVWRGVHDGTSLPKPFCLVNYIIMFHVEHNS